VTRGSVLPPDPFLDPSRDQSPDWTRYLAVDADLGIEVATAAGERTSGRLTGHGHRLRLDVDRPEILTGTTGRSTVSAVAAQLVRAHLRAELHGPRGRIAAVDSTRESRVSAVLTGSPHITIDRLGWALAARTVAPTIIAAVGIGGTALLAAAIVHRRRS
jgi:hypothetical protein